MKQSSIITFLPCSGESINRHRRNATETDIYTRDNHRAVKASWFQDFPWLEIDSNNFKCKVCVKAGKDNVFTRGKPTDRPKRDDITKHQGTVDHKSAVESERLAPSMKRAATNAYAGIKDAVLAQMATCLIQAQRDIPTSKNRHLLELQIFNGVSSLKYLKSEEGSQTHYTHSDSLNDLYLALKTVTEEEIVAEERESPYDIYGICIDEATDSANMSVVFIYKRYIDANGSVKTRFVSVRELQSTCAEDIYTAVRSVLQDKGYSQERMVGIAMDGAGNMVRVRKGVTTRFKQDIGHLIANHCMAHRLQLASEKAANQVPYIIKYIAVLNQFAKSLKFSPKLCRMLETAKELAGVRGTKIKQVFFTRWLSFQDSVQALVECIGPVISCLYDAAADRGLESQAVLRGVVKQMATYSFIAMTYFLADCIGILGTLSKIMQRENIEYSEIKQQIEAAIGALNKLESTPGPYSKQVEQLFPKVPDGSGYSTYMYHDVKDVPKERSKFKEATKLFTESLINQLETTYPDSHLMQPFLILNPSVCNSLYKDIKDSWDALDTLITRYNHLVNPEETRSEWMVISEIVKQDLYKTQNITTFFTSFLHPNRNSYPNLALLSAIALTIPVTSVDCERGVSRYNAIKTDSRSSLTVPNVDTLMVISLEGKSLKDFDFDRAFSKWISVKDRRGFANMVKECSTRKTKLSKSLCITESDSLLDLTTSEA